MASIEVACYHPLAAYQCADGSVVFHESGRLNTVRSLFLACGQCIGCRLERSRQWAMRCMHEASLYDENCFVTLTYDDAHLKSTSLEYADFQLFMKRLRKKFADRLIRFYMCGEYGEAFSRPKKNRCRKAPAICILVLSQARQQGRQGLDLPASE